MQYMRLFLDYTPTTADEFLNIALMDSENQIISYRILAHIYFMKGQLRLFYFASDPETNKNQTFLVSSIGVSDQTNTVGFKGMQIRFYL